MSATAGGCGRLERILAGDWRERRVTVMGLGLFGGGAGVARFLARRGARVTVTDLKGEEALRPSVESLAGFDVTLRLGHHVEDDFTSAELVVANPAVPPDAPLLEAARRHGIPVESEISLFFRLCPAEIVGITGSNGKTTTTRLMGEIFRACGRTTWVGGNVGGSILERVGEIGTGDTVVLELSSFQGEELERIRRSPSISVVLNLTPNHLDRHGTMSAYASAKQALLRHQTPADWAVLSGDDATVRAWGDVGRGRTLHFSVREPLESGAFVRDGRVTLRLDGRETPVVPVDRIRLLGAFNRANVLAAVTPPLLRGCPPEGIAEAVASFRGVEHRLELVDRVRGVAFYNDSIATTPESTLAALEAVPGRKWLIAGGYDKGVPIEDLASGIVRSAAGAALVGATARRLHDAIRACIPSSSSAPEIRCCDGLDDAVEWLVSRSRSGDAILLSPGFASYDQFTNFVERGERFRDIVRRRAAHGR
jgi:UDP-N-acetylmuramoylalanine--D-glutamate ligase